MTTITNPRDASVQAVFIRAHARMRAVGMTARGTSATQLRNAASRVSGKTYKSGQWQQIIDDMTAIINEAKG